jgi:hypothetical protein
MQSGECERPYQKIQLLTQVTNKGPVHTVRIVHTVEQFDRKVHLLLCSIELLQLLYENEIR